MGIYSFQSSETELKVAVGASVGVLFFIYFWNFWISGGEDVFLLNDVTKTLTRDIGTY